MSTLFVRLKGGLGNQLFQYSTARAIADDAGSQLVLMDSSYRRHSEYRWSFRNPLRPARFSRYSYGLGSFNIRTDPAEEGLMHETRVHRWMNEILRPIRLGVLGRRHPDFHPQLIKHVYARLVSGRDVFLEGYFQSELNFESRSGQIREDLRYRHAFSPVAEDLSKRIASAPIALGIHVRRGDRSTGHVDQLLPPLWFFVEGIAYIKRELSGVRLIVFSDDPEWVSTNMSLGTESLVVPTHVSAAESLALMSMCDHFVISNSTFGWWGAWLGSSAEKRVVAPSKWFLDQARTHPNILPRDWIRMDVA